MIDDVLASLLRAGAVRKMASQRAAVELLISADDGILLGAGPVRDTITVTVTEAVVDWAALYELGRAAVGKPRPDQVDDVKTLYQRGMSPKRLVNIAALGLMEWGDGDDEGEVDGWLSSAFEAAADRERFLRRAGGG